MKPLPGAGDPHLDDEALSAVLDGEAEVDETAHADACDVCRARLAALRDASVLVSTPVPPPDPARREAAIAAALAASERTADVVPLRSRRTAPAWLAAAAVIAAAVVGISLLPSSGGNDDDTAASPGDSASDDAGADATAMSEAAPDASLAMAAPYDGGDLGTIDIDTLRRQVEDGIASSQREAVADEDAAAATGGATNTTVANRATSCEPGLRTTYPDLGNLVYTASGTFDGDAMVVLGFDVGPDRWVFVVDAADCADIRNQQTYSR